LLPLSREKRAFLKERIGALIPTMREKIKSFLDFPFNVVFIRT